MHSLGIDAGASATKWALVSDGKISRQGIAGPMDGHLGRTESVERMQSTLTQIANECEVEVASIVIGITGVAETVEENAETIKIIQSIFGSAKIELLSDIHLAYRVHFPSGAGVLLYSGTGSVACVQIKGALTRVGGWGYLLGDEGAGYWIGREAIRALMYEVDQNKLPKPNSLEAQVAQHIGASDWAGVKKFAYGQNRSQIAALAKIVFKNQELPLAQKILKDAADHLVSLLARVDEITADPSLPVVFAGGTSRGEGVLNNRLKEEIGERLTISTIDIAEGAAHLAREASSQG